ncbi:uncharacterized [Tachysurus ichikawai]
MGADKLLKRALLLKPVQTNSIEPKPLALVRRPLTCISTKEDCRGQGSAPQDNDKPSSADLRDGGGQLCNGSRHGGASRNH